MSGRWDCCSPSTASAQALGTAVMEELASSHGWGGQYVQECLLQLWLVCLQVNREIVSGLKYIQHTFRKGVKSKCFSAWGAALGEGFLLPPLVMKAHPLELPLLVMGGD